MTLLRGNVGTRLAKLDSGEVDATLLALAGLRRLGLTEHVTAVLDTDDFLPAVGQGAIAIAIRAGDERVQDGARADPRCGDRSRRSRRSAPSWRCSTAPAGRRSPATRGWSDGGIEFRGLVLRPDGSDSLERRPARTAGEAAALGREAGLELRARMPADFLAA